MIGNRPVVFRKTAGTMLRYKRQFGRELYPDLIKIYDLYPVLQQYTEEKEAENSEARKIELAKVMLGSETGWMYDIAYIMAQQADPSIKDQVEWLDRFDDMNIFEVFMQLMPMIRMEQQVSPKNV